MRHHPGADRLEVARQVELGDRIAVARVRPQRLLGLGDEDTHDERFFFIRRPGFPRSGRRRIGERTVSAGAGVWVSTSDAGLSSRSPLKAAWRTMPSPVQPANSISATSLA